MNDNTIKTNIAKLRTSSGLTQTEMADKLGISRTAYRNLEMGGTRLISENIDKIASLLDKDPEEVLLGYKPIRSDSKKLNDIRREYLDRQKKIENDYSAEIDNLKSKLNYLEDCVEAQKELIRTKDEIISMLKKNMG